MIYKEFGKTGAKVSCLGFGAMRLPMKEVDGTKIVDDDLAVPLMQKAFDMGINYVDTAPLYCEKLSEVSVGKALKGYRDKVYLSTKNPIEDNDGDHWMERLENSLKKLDTDYIDFYHFWGINLKSFQGWQNLKYGPLEAAQKAKDQGLIKHISFSYHDAAENYKPIVDSGLFETTLVQYNLLDRSNEENIAYAKSKGLGVVIMGPVGGGRLGAPSEKIQGLLKNKPASTAEMALRFVLANENVDIALSGMGDIKMLNENFEVASRTGHLTEEELLHIKKMMEENKNHANLYCTGCNYCKPCPQGIDIPYLFEIMNRWRVYDLKEHAKSAYYEMMKGWSWIKSTDASKCVNCGQCEEKCPQKLPIIKQLQETHATLAP
uniref:Aldo/keto reductase n=1 Tax=uncultured bacterium contig00023 TaxID=1181512 RepID=A0A806KPC2_9BACT|nr:aldo/keto reductase [uncultured bacterium contig00023]